MDSNIAIKIVEPGTGATVPNTGLFLNGIGGPEIATIVSATLIVAILILAVTYHRKKKRGKLGSILLLFKVTPRHKKITAISLATLAMVVALGTFAALIKTGANALNAVVDCNTITIELGDKPVFAYVPATIAAGEEIPSGYIIKAYAPETELRSENTDQTISIVSPADNTTSASMLTDNTWGLSLDEPTSETNPIFYSLPQTKEDAIAIDTDAKGTSTVYYGVYVVPGLPYGTYTGAVINYDIEPNDASTVIYDSNGLYFNDNTTQTTNIVKYVAAATDETEMYSHTPNISDNGTKNSNIQFNTSVNEVVTVPGAASIKINLTYGGGNYNGAYQMGYLSFWQGSHSDYRANVDNASGIQSCGDAISANGRYYSNNDNLDEDIVNTECEITGDTVTFDYWTESGGPGGTIWYGYYAVITGYDAAGNIIRLPGNKAVAGEYQEPSSKAAYKFYGWSLDPEATEPTYRDLRDIKLNLVLEPGSTTTLYAVQDPTFSISYNGNGADPITNMDQVEQYTTDLESTSKQVDLQAPNFIKQGYGFVGWSTDADAWDRLTDDDDANNPTIFGPSQTITIDEELKAKAGEDRKLVLHAIWAPAETDNSGEPVSLQNWQGCSDLDPSAYNSATGTLSVGRHTVTVLTDSRDGATYTVARLADGNCWMTENLRLDSDAEITVTNTHNPATTEGTTTVAIKNNDGSLTDHLSPTNSDWCIYDWDASHEESCTNQSYLNTDNTTSITISPVSSYDFTEAPPSWSSKIGGLDTNLYSYGNYYNWYSATAGNGKYYNASGSYPISSINGDICPAGWQLPYGGSGDTNSGKGNTSGGFYYLNNLLGGGSNAWRSFPNNFIYSGFWFDKSASARGEAGYYWSATTNSDTRYVFTLNFYHSNLDQGTGNGEKSFGESVRCVSIVE